MRFEAVKRTAVDGKMWWVIWDNKTHDYCTLYMLNDKYKTKRDCILTIKMYQNMYSKEG